MTYSRIGCWILLFILASCQATIDFESFDAMVWQRDANGCLGDRVELLPDLLKEKDKLMGLNAKAIARTLGNPDRQELYVRSQQFFIYLVDPAAACGDERTPDKPRQLHLRFNATGKVNEISLQY